MTSALASLGHAQSACDALLDEARRASLGAHTTGEQHYVFTALEKSSEARACFSETNPAARAWTYNYEVYALHKLERISEAHAVLETFFQTFPVVLDSTLWARMYHRSGFVAQKLGAFADAQHAYAEAARYASALPLLNRAEIYVSQPEFLDLMGDGVRARMLYDRLVDLLRVPAETDPTLRSILGRTLWQVANSSMTQSRGDAEVLRRAEKTAREALHVLGGGDREADRQLVYATFTLALILDRLGETDGAHQLFQQAVRDAEAHGHRMTRMQAWGFLGRWQLDHGEAEAALVSLQHRLDLALGYGEDGEQRQAQYAYAAMGEAYEVLGRTEEAVAAYENAIALAERHRASLGTTTWAATAFADWQEPYRFLARIRLAQDRPEEAFTLLERTRARALHDLRQSSRDLAHLDAAERVRLDSLDREIEQLREAVRQETVASVQRHARLAKLEAERYGTTDTLTYTPPTPSEVQQALAPDQVVLSYFLQDESYVFVITAEALHAIPLDVSAAAVDSLVRAVSPLWREAAIPTRRATEFEMDPLHALYVALVAPVASLLPSDAALVVVPDGPLVRIPFAMLLEAPTPRFQYADAPFLVRRYPITTELAAALLTDTTTARADPGLDVLAFGRSIFVADASVPRTDSTLALPDLPVVEREIRFLHGLFPDGAAALNADATEAALEARLGEARVVHLASHAMVNESQPLYSYVDLWPGMTGADDGRLYLYELAGRQLDAELVVLSGCSTARGQVLAGEGMNGLHYAFRAAGAAASVATLWHVDDEASGDLVERFYRHLRAGMSKDRALQRAQLDYLAEAQGTRASPFYWAAPVLYGSPDPVAWAERPARSSVGWVGLGLMLIALGLALPHVARRRRS